MNLANTIKAMYEKRNSPPWDDDGGNDYAGAAKKIRAYAKKSGGIDKDDMLSIANQLDALAKRSTPKLLARTMANIGSLDTDVRDKIKELMKESNCMEALELDEAMVRGKEVFDKTFANRTQADNFAKKNGGRVRQIGRVFYVFKEEMKEEGDEEDQEKCPECDKYPCECEDVKTTESSCGSKKMKEDVDFDELFEETLEEGKSSTGYELYHKDFSSAMKHAYDHAKKKFGIEVDPKEIDDKVASGPRKPSKGKTNTYRLKGKDGKKAVQIQVYGMDNGKYELNMYKESVELDENAGLIKDYQGMKAQGKKDSNILDALMSMPKYKRMSKDQMAKIIGDAKRKGIFKEEVELEEAYKTPSEAKAYEDGKKSARSGKKYDDNPNKKGSKEYTAWSKGHNEARAKGMKEESELDEAFMKWQVKVGAKVWRGTARNAGEAVKKARPSMGNLDLSKASVTRIDEEKVEENTMTLEEAIMQAVFGEAKKVKEDNTNDKSDDGEGMDKVQPKALKKKFDDRKDKDIDNDGDTDDSDEYLHNKRKAVSKAIKKDKKKDDGEGATTGSQDPVDTKPALDEEVSPEVMKMVQRYGKSDEVSRLKRYGAETRGLTPDQIRDKNGIIARARAKAGMREEVERIMESFEPNRFAQYGDRAEQVMELTAIKMAEKKHK